MSYSHLKSSTYRTTIPFPISTFAGEMVSNLFHSPVHIFRRTLLLGLTFFIALPCFAQDWIRTGTGLGVEKVRLAASDFKATTQDPKNADLLKAFNDTLWNDLDNAGIFDMVSKSFYPLQVPGNPSEVRFEAWNGPPPNASMLAFGDLGVTANNVLVHGWLYDVKNTASPQVLGKQYTDSATTEGARLIAHRFANEIIFRLGGGVAGICESKIYFVSDRSGLPQIYTMEADGTNVQRVTDQGYAVSPSWSPNGQFLSFSWFRKYGAGAPGANDIYLMDIASKQWVQLTHDGGRNDFPSWSPDGRHIVFQSSRSGKEEIWMMLADGTKTRQLTFTGRNTQPNWSWK